MIRYNNSIGKIFLLSYFNNINKSVLSRKIFKELYFLSRKVKNKYKLIRFYSKGKKKIKVERKKIAILNFYKMKV